eukprot:g45325.t1
MLLISNPLYEAVDQTQSDILKKEQVTPRNLRKGAPATSEKVPSPYHPSANKLAQPGVSKKLNRQVPLPVPQSRSRSYTCSELRRPGQGASHSGQAEAKAHHLVSGVISLSEQPPSLARPPLPMKSQKVLELQHAMKDYRETSVLPAHHKQHGNEALGQQASVS